MRRSRALGRYDQRALLGMGRLRDDRLTKVMRAFTYAGDGQSWLLVGLFLATLGRRGRRKALLLGLAQTLATGVSEALKHLINRPRPSEALEGFEVLADDPDAFSFPSGHASGAFAAAMALGGDGDAAGPLLAMHALGIAVSRVYLGAHYPFDVLVGALIGAGSGLTVRWLAA